ncbi:glycoside hydrolase family 43 C-terminal domain-containing protein [Aliiroseovarius sp. F47248L]|uniref:lipocalin-like domain-containing protein n=1 Tax=Aliiroseovarius sp. F47248L TaxID=2926420 RepID=UPI001FF594EF|nr:glycoside hydrolase family 43 C-terminal domain-containing protein [Aliiroseovarius sp. F47248L]MCK0138840.1 hypothetical protein [Aliiroseovarius sp. F47248L]
MHPDFEQNPKYGMIVSLQSLKISGGYSMTYVLIKPVLVAVLLTGCQMGNQQSTSEATMQQTETGSLSTLLSGRTLTNKDADVTLHADGRLSGSGGVDGTWEVRDGKYCRTISKPDKWKGTECQVVTTAGDQITFTSPSGRTSTWTM